MDCWSPNYAQFEALTQGALGGPSSLSGGMPNTGSSDATASAHYFMYCYKVVLCPKKYSHDWGACPYAHDKEKARRRDPQLFKYSSCICPNSSKGECPNGLDCPYAHTLFEYWLHPSRFRTTMCRSGRDCKRSLCFFAHSESELRTPTKCGPSQAHGQQHQPLLGTAAVLPTATTGYTPSASAAVTSLLGSLLPASCRPGSEASLAVSGPDAVSWPLAVEGSNGGSFTSQASGVASGSLLPHMPTSTNSIMGNAGALMAGAASNPLMFLPATAGMPAAYVNLQQQQQQQQSAVPTELLLQLQQQLELKQSRLQQLELELLQQQANVNAMLQGGGAGAAFAPAGMQDLCSVAAATSCMGSVSGAAAPVQLVLSNSSSPRGCISPALGRSNVTLPTLSQASSQFGVGFDSGSNALVADPLLVAAQRQAVQQNCAVESWV